MTTMPATTPASPATLTLATSAGRDTLLLGVSASVQPLRAWKDETPDLHDFVPDFHRLQLEHWVWSRRAALGRAILDVGVQNPRRWLGAGYVTCGEYDEDVRGTLLALPFEAATFDGVILTEVLEHCINPWVALDEVRRVLKPEGVLLVTSPFLWPWHGTHEYRDYWRFTDDAWRALLANYRDVSITPCAWTSEGAALCDLLRRFEGWGFRALVKMTTGYLCEARK